MTNDGRDNFWRDRYQYDGKWGFVNKTGRCVIPAKYDYVRPFHEGLAGVRLNGKWGFIDKQGKVVIPLKYDYAESFSEGLAAVKLDAKLSFKWGFVDVTGKEAIPPKYDEVRSFSEGLAKVKLNGKWGLVDITGKVVIPLKYKYVKNFSEGLAAVKLDAKWGILAMWGFVDGKWGFVDKKGNEYWDMDEDEAREQMNKRKIVGNTVSEDKSMSEVKKEASSSELIPQFDLTAELARLDKLKKDGLITAEDYEVLKKRAIEKTKE